MDFHTFSSKGTSVRDDSLARLLINEVNMQDPPSIYLIVVTMETAQKSLQKIKERKFWSQKEVFLRDALEIITAR